MINAFQLYFGLGKDHILDYANGYDHLLFIIALCAVYLFRDWKKVLVLVTAFTIGHSITLALATLRLITVKDEWIEFLIPVTILVTALTNLFKLKEDRVNSRPFPINYFYALGFGLIHGMGFSNYLRAILGESHSLAMPLFAFNVGLEVGQIVVVLIFLLIAFFVVELFGVSRRDWKMVISSAVGGIAFVLMKENVFW